MNFHPVWKMSSWLREYELRIAIFFLKIAKNIIPNKVVACKHDWQANSLTLAPTWETSPIFTTWLQTMLLIAR